MLSAMRLSLRAAFLALTTLALASTGCDLINKLKGAAGDAGVDAAVAAVAVPDAAAPAELADAEAAPSPSAPGAPTGTLHHVAVVDGGVRLDAGKLDGGPAPAPTPTLKLPPGLFDGGLPKIDAGGLKLPWQK